MTSLALATWLLVTPGVQARRDWQAANIKAGLSANGRPAIASSWLWINNDGVWDRRME